MPTPTAGLGRRWALADSRSPSEAALSNPAWTRRNDPAVGATHEDAERTGSAVMSTRRDSTLTAGSDQRRSTSQIRMERASAPLRRRCPTLETLFSRRRGCHSERLPTICDARWHRLRNRCTDRGRHNTCGHSRSNNRLAHSADPPRLLGLCTCRGQNVAPTLRTFAHLPRPPAKLKLELGVRDHL